MQGVAPWAKCRFLPPAVGCCLTKPATLEDALVGDSGSHDSPKTSSDKDPADLHQGRAMQPPHGAAIEAAARARQRWLPTAFGVEGLYQPLIMLGRGSSGQAWLCRCVATGSHQAKLAGTPGHETPAHTKWYLGLLSVLLGLSMQQAGACAAQHCCSSWQSAAEPQRRDINSWNAGT